MEVCEVIDEVETTVLGLIEALESEGSGTSRKRMKPLDKLRNLTNCPRPKEVEDRWKRTESYWIEEYF